MFKTTTVRLPEEHLEKLDRLAKHLQAVARMPKASRSAAMSYLIDKALDERGRPSWEVLGILPPDAFDGSDDVWDDDDGD